jgi:hypothetical protein
MLYTRGLQTFFTQATYDFTLQVAGQRTKNIDILYIEYLGVEVVVRGLEGIYLADRLLHTNKTRVMPFIPTKSIACMSTSWLLGNVYTAKSSKSEKRGLDALKLGLVS